MAEDDGSRAEAPELEDLLADPEWLTGVAKQLARDTHLVDDLVQEARVYSLEHPPRNAANLKGWAARVVRTLLASFKRREQIRVRHERRSPNKQSTPTPIEQLELKEIQSVVAEAVLQLASPYKETVMLYYYDGRTTKEIARHFAISESTVRVRRKRAMHRLRGFIEAVFGEFETQAGALPPTVVAPSSAVIPAPRQTTVLVTARDQPSPLAGARLLTPDPLAQYARYTVGSVHRNEFAWWMQRGKYTVMATTDENGVTHLPSSVLRKASIKVEVDGYGVLVDFLRLRNLRRLPFVFELGPIEVVTVVVLMPDGTPAIGVAAQVWASSGYRRGFRTDSDGTFRFPWHDATHHAVEVDVDGYVPAQRLAQGPITSIALERGRSARGIVLDADGSAVAGCQVLLTFTGWPGQYSAGCTDSDGLFLTPALPDEGECQLVFRHSEFVERTATSSLPWLRRRSFRLEKGGSIEGVIRAPDGTVVEEGQVLLVANRLRRREDTPACWNAPVDKHGSYRIAAVSTGSYRVHVEHTNLASQESTVSLESGQTLIHNITLAHGSAIAGRVVDTAGQPVSGLRLTCGGILGTQIHGRATSSLEDGTFYLHGLPCDRPAIPRYALCSFVESTVGRLAQRQKEALLLKISMPDQLVEKDGEPIPIHGIFGSSNTCMVSPGNLDLTLVVREPPSNIPRIYFKDRCGVRVRSRAYVEFDTPDGSNYRTPLALDGSPLNVWDSDGLAGSLVTVFVDGYRWSHTHIDSHDGFPLTVILEELEAGEVTVRVKDQAGQPAASREIFVQPLLDRLPSAEIFAGRTNRAGVLRLQGLAECRYRVLVALKPRHSRRDRSCTTPLSIARHPPAADSSSAVLGEVHPRAGQDQELCGTI